MRESLCGIRHSPAQCAQLTLTPDVVWDRDFGSSCASCVAIVQATDHREGDDLPPVRRLALDKDGSALLRQFFSLFGCDKLFLRVVQLLRSNYHLHRHPKVHRTTLCVTGPRNHSKGLPVRQALFAFAGAGFS